MRITKLFFTLAFLSITFLTNAASITEPQSEKALAKEIKQLLVSSEIAKLTDESFAINFMVNNQNEIVVTSTSSNVADSYVKNLLNYQKIDTKGLEVFKVYTLKVKVEKK